MATWKKVLTEADGNIGTADQTVPSNVNRKLLLDWPNAAFSSTIFTVDGNVDGGGTGKALFLASISRNYDASSSATINHTGTTILRPGAQLGYTGNQSELRFYEYTTTENGSTNYVAFRGSPSAMSVNYTLDLPAAEPGSAGKVPYITSYDTATNVGTLSWLTLPITSWTGQGDNYVLFGGASSGLVESDSDFQYTSTDSIKTLLLDDSIIVCKSSPTEPAGLVLDGANKHGDSALNGQNDAASGIYITFDITASSSVIDNVLSLNTNGEIFQAQADSVANANGLMGLYLETSTGGTTTNTRLLTYGLANLNASMVNGTFGTGKPMFLDPSNAGEVTFTRPSTSGQVVRILGYGIKQFTYSSVTYTQVMFMPSTDYILLA